MRRWRKLHNEEVFILLVPSELYLVLSSTNINGLKQIRRGIHHTRRDEKCIQNFSRKPEGTRPFGNLCVNVRIILIRILNKLV
jgi:hypothetical protein